MLLRNLKINARSSSRRRNNSTNSDSGKFNLVNTLEVVAHKHPGGFPACVLRQGWKIHELEIIDRRGDSPDLMSFWNGIWVRLLNKVQNLLSNAIDRESASLFPFEKVAGGPRACSGQIGS